MNRKWAELWIIQLKNSCFTVNKVSLQLNSYRKVMTRCKCIHDVVELISLLRATTRLQVFYSFAHFAKVFFFFLSLTFKKIASKLLTSLTCLIKPVVTAVRDAGRRLHSFLSTSISKYQVWYRYFCAPPLLTQIIMKNSLFFYKSKHISLSICIFMLDVLLQEMQLHWAHVETVGSMHVNTNLMLRHSDEYKWAKITILNI